MTKCFNCNSELNKTHNTIICDSCKTEYVTTEQLLDGFMKIKNSI